MKKPKTYSASDELPPGISHVECSYGEVGIIISRLQKETGTRVIAMNQTDDGWMLTVSRLNVQPMDF